MSADKGSGTRIIILGATSGIAEATARIWAAQGGRLVLVARDGARAEAIAADLKVRGAEEADVVALDLAKADAAAELDAMVAKLGGLDIVLLAYGALGDQKTLETDPTAARALIETNFTSASAWCIAAANRFEAQKSGALLVIGSVAGDRGRQSNFIYGATKAGLAALVEGIAHRLAPTGARAVLIKPGFVDTPMTAAIPNKGALWAKPEAVGAIIARAAQKGRPVVYAPGFWRLIMLIVRNVPAAIFHKTKL
ncbi:SDR family oxidoreductase [Bosea sp. 117]|uniref:SDR family oxidoreductase n=1 Tax=Bosea sp. 117 TaxID=1125973 RepID=UPI0004947666|nr:SDR family oxidoreductase [Bosea sp. 117]